MTQKRKIIGFVLVLSLLSLTMLGFAGCGSKSREPVSKEGYYFDTICTIFIYDMEEMNESNANKVIDGALEECDKYEKILSKTKKHSDVYAINHAGGKPVSCHSDTIEVLKKAIHYGELSQGAFDVTVGKAENLYNFHQEGKHSIPTAQQLSNAVSHINYKKIHVKGNDVSLDDPKMELDLGGIAKGYIGDRIGAWLEKKGVSSAIISLGGNIICVGDKFGKPFNVGVEKPFSEQKDIVGTTKVKNKTVVTSGIYERYFKKDGKLYHHIIDPKTGVPADTDVQGVTIVAKDGHSGDCDALATICLLLGKDKGLKLMESQKGYEALFLTKNGKITKTENMDFQEAEEDTQE